MSVCRSFGESCFISLDLGTLRLPDAEDVGYLSSGFCLHAGAMCPHFPQSAALARPTLFTIDVLLRTYSGERLNIRGEIKVDVQFRDKQARLNLLVVVMRNGPSLMGRDWISVLQPNFSVLRSSIDGCLQSLLGKHSVLFKEELGQIKGVRSIWILRPGHFFSNQDQYHMPCELEWRKKLNRLEAADITEPVTHSDLAAPVVPMVKGDGSIRLCGDYKLTVNRVASLEKNPLPRIEDMISSLGKRKEARPCQCLFSGRTGTRIKEISTHKGLFKYNRLPFGVASALAILWKTSCKAFKMHWCTWMISWWQDHRRQNTCNY